jgi:hypothetical protein
MRRAALVERRATASRGPRRRTPRRTADGRFRIIDAIAVVFKDERARLGIQMKAD